MSLASFGKRVLLAVDPDRSLDGLECNICQYFFNSRQRKPVIACQVPACSSEHYLCLECYELLVNKKKAQNEDNQIPVEARENAKCPFCIQPMGQPIDDRTKMEDCQRLEQVFGRLREIEREIETIHEQKIKEINDRSTAQVNKYKEQVAEKNYKVERLKRQMELKDREVEAKMASIAEREEYVRKREAQVASTIQKLLDDTKKLRQENGEQNLKNDALQKENQLLRTRLEKHQDREYIQSIENRIKPVRSSKELDKWYDFGAIFQEFRFSPFVDAKFMQNFMNGPNKSIQLRPQRLEYFLANGGKVVRHSKLFSIGITEDKQICFKVRGQNPDTKVYKFGLMDKHSKEIPGASLSIDISKGDLQSSAAVVWFYVDLNKMKLYASMKELREESSIPRKANLTSFTVYLYFLEIETQIIVD